MQPGLAPVPDGADLAVADGRVAPPLHDAENLLPAQQRAEDDLARAKRKLEETSEALREQADWLRVTLGSIGDAVVTVDRDRRVSYLNSAAEELTGWPADAALGRAANLVIHLVDEVTGGTLASPIDRVFGGEEKVSPANAMVLRRRDGALRWIEDTAAPIRNSAGEMIGVTVVFRDVSERRRREHALAQSEERFRLLSTVAPHLMWTTDASGKAEYFSDRWYSFTGQSETEATGDGWALALHPEDREATVSTWARSVATGEPYEMEYRLRRRDGEYRWFVARGVPLPGMNGRIVRWYGTCTDIHQRRMTAEALREESMVTEQLFEVAKALSTELDLERVVQIITDAGTRVTHAQFGAFFYNVLDAQGESYMLYTLSGVPREAFEKFPMPRTTALFGPTFRGEGIIRLGDVRKDSRFGHNAPHHGMPKGHLPVVSYLAAPVISRSGEVLGGLFFGHSDPDVFKERDERIIRGIAAQAAAAMDTAGLYQAEQKARSAAEAASQAKDHFLAVLSHELRTPLTPVLMAAASQERNPELPESVRREMAMIRRNVELEARLIDDLLDLNRIATGKLVLHPEPVDLADKIQHVCSICRPRALEKRIEMTAHVDAQLGALQADPARMQQVLWNLVNNAIKFTREGGRVEIHAGNFGDDQLRIEVKDNGVGIDPQVLPQIFDAFEQGSAGVTREFGGLGLGLAITKALVEMHRGSIKAESAGAGQGATFTVWLPRGLPEHLPAKDPPTSRRISDEASLRLLVVEDHADTARTLGLLLRRAGFDVVTAPDVAGALERMQQQEFDVLVSDLGLPDGTGYDLMRAVRQRTTIPGIAMSGYGMEEDLRRSQEAGFVEHLVKPVSIAKLKEAIHRLRLTR